MSFVLGRRSKQRLFGVDPRLVSVVERAIEISEVDFTVIEGIRSRSRQRDLVNRGKSRTMNSRHLTGHAVDVAPWVRGSISWNWKYFYPIADAFIRSSKELQVPIRWGGNWRVHDVRDWPNNDGQSLAAAYTGDFPDGPHWEIPR